jgi:hypothetical protein
MTVLPSGGLSQEQLDQLATTGCSDGEEEPARDSHGVQTDEMEEELVSKDRRRKRVEPLVLANETAHCSPDELDLRGGLTQPALDKMAVDDSEVRNGAVQTDSTEPLSNALYQAKRRKRISFTGMVAEIQCMANETPGGLTQEQLDELAVPDDDIREDSPISTSLCRRKKSRVSKYGAGPQNMLVVAHETLGGDESDDASKNILASSPPKSPLKTRTKQIDPENMHQRARSPTKARHAAGGKAMLSTPPRRRHSGTPLTPSNT